MAEDPEAAAEEASLDPVALDVLRGQEADERLCGGQLDRGDPTSALIPCSSCSSSASSRPPVSRVTS